MSRHVLEREGPRAISRVVRRRHPTLLVLIGLAGIGCAAEHDLIRPQPTLAWDPWLAAPDTDHSAERTAGVGTSLIHAYRRSLRRPAFQCPMTPACSAFALEALDRFGPVGGLLLTLDRMVMREGHEMHLHYDVVFVDGEPRYLDPVPQ